MAEELENNQDTLNVPLDEKSILYDRLVPVEWPEIKTILDTSKGLSYLWKNISTAVNDCLRSSLEKVQHPLQLFGVGSSTPSAIVRVINCRLPWQLAITSDGALLGVLKDEVIEIRTLLDGFDRPCANLRVERDPNPQWRQLLWNDEGSLLAYGASDGLVQVFSSAGALLCQFGGAVTEDSGLEQAVASLVFMPRQKNDPANVISLLCVLTFDGTLNTYQICSTGPVHLHSFSFANYFPEGVTCLAYHSQHNLLLVGSSSSPSEAEGCGVSGWRLLDDTPYWGPKVGQSVEKVKTGYIRGLISRKKSSKRNSNIIVDMSLSPNGAFLAVIDVAGNLSIVEVPSFRSKKFWSFKQLPSNKTTDEKGSSKG